MAKTSDGSNNQRGQVKTHGLITEGLLKKGGINSTAPTPKPAPPPGQAVPPAGTAQTSSTGGQSGGSGNG